MSGATSLAAASADAEVEVRIDGRTVTCRLRKMAGRRLLLAAPSALAELLNHRANQPITLSMLQDGQWSEGEAVVRGWVWAQPALLGVELRSNWTSVPRRRTPRLASDLRCRLTLAGGQSHEGQVRDLSDSGARVQVRGHPKISNGDHCELVLWAEEALELRAIPARAARVTRTFRQNAPTADLGLEFLAAPPDLHPLPRLLPTVNE